MSKIPVEYIDSPKFKVGVAIAAGTLAVGALIGLNHQTNEGIRDRYANAEAKAVQEIDSATNGILVVRSGAKYRTAPKMGGSESDGAPTTLAGEVPDGKVMVLDRPLEYRDDDGDMWAGFELANKPTDGGTADASKLLWINVTQLNKLNETGERYVERFDYASKSTPIDLPVLKISLDEFGTFQGSEMKSGYPLAVGQIVSDEVFTQRVQSENLSLAG